MTDAPPDPEHAPDAPDDAPAPPADAGPAAPGMGLWSRLEDRFGVVSLRPRLASDVRVRRIGDDY